MHDPTEHVQEHIQHTAAHGDEHGSGGHASRWITAAALTAAFLAAFAAVTGALATRHLTESTLKRIEANDNWNFYQSKSIKNSILDAKIYSAQLAKAPPRKKDTDKIAEYAEELPKIQKEAEGLQVLSKTHLETHETYEFAATMFHISIAIVAIAVVAKRKSFWYMSMVLGAVGVFYFGKAYMHAPIEEQHTEVAATAPAKEPTKEPAAHAPATEQAAEHPATAPSPNP
jgi:hypothetical protein